LMNWPTTMAQSRGPGCLYGFGQLRSKEWRAGVRRRRIGMTIILRRQSSKNAA
jgi:hypothetical protein